MTTPATIPSVSLTGGVQMPLIGFGTYQIDPEETERAVSAALEAGYRHIDTAAAYRNEEGVGRAIAASGIPREELFVTTKLWVQDAGEEAARTAFETSLGNLGLDRLDLYLVHQPFGDYYGAWRTLRALQEEGRCRAVGVSNFYPDRLVDLIERTGFAPAVNQVEAHPFFQREDERTLMAERGVRMESWGSFAEGKNDLFTNSVLTEVGEQYGKSPAQVTLRWLMQREVPVIPKSVHPERMSENLDVLDFELSAEDMRRIADLDGGTSLFVDHRDPGFASAIGGMTIHD